MSLQQNRSTSPFVLIRIRMLRSPEFRRLSLSAQMLWIYLRAQFNPYNADCFNPATGRGQVYLPYSELQNINGFRSSATISKAFKELIKNDLIEVVEKGGLYGGPSAYAFKGKYAHWQNIRRSWKNGRIHMHSKNKPNNQK